MLYKMVLTFESVGGILKYHYSPKSYRAVLSCGIVHYAVQDGSNFRSYHLDETSLVKYVHKKN